MPGILALWLTLQVNVVTLRQAEHRAEISHPAVAASQADAAVAAAVAMQARAALLPQVNLNANYRYATANRTVRIGTAPQFASALVTSRPASTTLFDYLSTGVNVSQLIYDFGQAHAAARAAVLQAEAGSLAAQATRLDVLLAVRLAFFATRAARELAQVAREAFANQKEHLAQVESFVELQVRPPIDVVQGRADLGVAELRVIAAENDLAVAKLELARAMGDSSDDDFDLGGDEMAPIDGEDQPGPALVASAGTRPDVLGADRQVKANEQALSAARGGYGPQLHLVVAATDAGPMFHPGPFARDNLRWNYSAALALTWSLSEGGRTLGRNRQASAAVDAARARRSLLELDVRLQVERARRAISSAAASIRISRTTVTNAEERLRLATGRYQTGVGTSLEVRDAQLAYVAAAASSVQANFDLSAARAQMLRTLGRAY